MPLKKPRCEACGSDDIAFDAIAAWDTGSQSYELITTYDHATCQTCGSTSIRWVESK